MIIANYGGVRASVEFVLLPREYIAPIIPIVYHIPLHPKQTTCRIPFRLLLPCTYPTSLFPTIVPPPAPTHPIYTYLSLFSNPIAKSYNNKMSSTFLSTFATLFCLPCEPHSTPHATKNKAVCNQYGKRLYLRPNMPAMTRRQSRREGEGKKVAGDEMSERTVAYGAEETSVGRVGSLRIEDKEEEGKNMGVKEDRVVSAPQSSRNETTRGENIGTEDPLSEPPLSAQSLKSRTFSMEMTDALEALHREEEAVELARRK
jgi:hypothetical protein